MLRVLTDEAPHQQFAEIDAVLDQELGRCASSCCDPGEIHFLQLNAAVIQLEVPLRSIRRGAHRCCFPCSGVDCRIGAAVSRTWCLKKQRLGISRIAL